MPTVDAGAQRCRLWLRFGWTVGLALCALALACQSGAARPATAGGATPAAQELQALETELRAKHPDPFGRCGENSFREALRTALAGLPVEQPAQWHLELRKLVARVGDAHTRVEGIGAFATSSAPLLVRAFADGWWIVGCYAGFEDLVGNRILQLEGRSMNEVVHALRPYVSFDNEASLRQAVPHFLMRPEFLHALGLLAEPSRMTLNLEDLHGRRRTTFVPTIAEDRHFYVFPIHPEVAQPWVARQPERLYWFDYPRERTLYLRYRACRSDPEQPMAGFAAELRQSLALRTPQRAIVDLCDNAGGDSQVLAPVIAALRAQQQAGMELWVLVNAATYSSGLLNAWQLRTRAAAQLAGEPSAQRPNSFGEVRRFTLPISKTVVSCSTKSFRLLEQDLEALPVDLYVEQRAEDWFRGRDPLLDRLLGD